MVSCQWILGGVAIVYARCLWLEMFYLAGGHPVSWADWRGEDCGDVRKLWLQRRPLEFLNVNTRVFKNRRPWYFLGSTHFKEKKSRRTNRVTRSPQNLMLSEASSTSSVRFWTPAMGLVNDDDGFDLFACWKLGVWLWQRVQDLNSMVLRHRSWCAFQVHPGSEGFLFLKGQELFLRAWHLAAFEAWVESRDWEFSDHPKLTIRNYQTMEDNQRSKDIKNLSCRLFEAASRVGNMQEVGRSKTWEAAF